MSAASGLFHLREPTDAMTSGSSDTLQRVAERILRVTRAEAVYIERAGAGRGTARVVAAAGVSAPAVGARPPHATPAHVEETRVVVGDGSGQLLGTVALLGTTAAVRSPRTTRQLTLLLDVVRLALHVSALGEEVELRRQELEQSIDEKYRLISGITYELKETLGVAAEYVELLDTESELSERQRDYIASNRRTMASAVRLIGDLLELARIEAGRLPVHPEPTSLGALLRDMASDYRLASATYGVEVITDVPQDLPLVRTDPDLVGPILDNLLSNAVRYTPANGVIRIRADVQRAERTAAARRWLRVTISDSGPGVREAQDVFEAIDRVSRRHGAPGFRLAISRNVARLLGGDLTLESRPGEGASFALWLPLEE